MLQRVNEKLNKHKQIAQICGFALYIVATIVVSIYHEPWYDEAQSWQIAKYASLYDMLFVLPHDEGHPPLWWLILSIPARSGLPYELGLKTVEILISAAVAYMIIFRSPFPLLVRLLLPFNYFLFYQYGVIVRPYGLMGVSCLLAAEWFKEKDSRPLRFVLALILLCFTSAYGIVIAGGIAICWCIEIIKEKGFTRAVKESFADKRTLSLYLLLAAAVLLIIEIIPNPDTYAVGLEFEGSLLSRFFALLITCFSETLLTSGSWFDGDSLIFLTGEWISTNFDCVVAGIILWIAIILISKKDTLKYLIVPVTVLCAFSSKVYIYAHHMGMFLFLLLFWSWINTVPDKMNSRRQKLTINASDMLLLSGFKKAFHELAPTKKNIMKRTLKVCTEAGIVLILVIPIRWTVISCYYEVKYPYSYGRSTAIFLKENNYDKLLIFSDWKETDKNGDEEISLDEMNTKFVADAVSILPYFEDNIVANLNTDEQKQPYTIHRNASVETVIENLHMWRELGTPDALIGKVNIEAITDGDMELYRDYAPVCKMEEYHIWKGKPGYGLSFVFLRRDLIA